MRILLASFILLFFLQVCLAQDCPTQPILITNQQEMESFANNYPNCSEWNKSFSLEGPDVVSVTDLSFLRKLNGGLSIINTGLTSLKGFEDLESINAILSIKNNSQLESLTPLNITTSEDVAYGSHLDIENNPKLNSLKGLENLQLVHAMSSVRIVNNSSLNICTFENLCQFLNSYNIDYKIVGNGEDCNFRESILEQCGLYPDPIDGELFFADGFEQLDDMGHPTGWDGNSFVSFNGPNIKLVNALTEGDSALWLSSNNPFFEGYLDAYTRIELPSIYTKLDIVLTLSCKGQGSCNIVLGQTVDGNGYNHRHFWNRGAGDEETYTVYLNDIKVSPPFAGFGFIELKASPIWTSIGSYGISEFTIDDLKIYGDGELVNVNISNAVAFSMFPNPASDRLYFELDDEYANSNLEVFSLNGALLRKQKFSNSLDVSDLPKGMYIVRLSGAQKVITNTFVKM